MLVLTLSATGLLAGCSADKAQNPTAGTSANAEKASTLIVGMTASDIPSMDSQPTNGGEGYRFVCFQLYDALVKWDCTKGDEASDICPGLAESWEQSSEDLNLWTFNLRKGVKFHDGSEFNADDVIFAYDRLMNKDSKYYSSALTARVSQYVSKLASVEKIDDYTVKVTTTEPESALPYNLSWVCIPNDKTVEQYSEDYQYNPCGTGPFKLESYQDGQELVLAANKDYWDGAPKLNKLVLKPMPEASTRLTALQSGEINWAEAVPPESIETLKAQNYQVELNSYPHIWAYILNLDDPIWSNKLVRQAVNYAVDRKSLCDSLIYGCGTPATQFYTAESKWYSKDATDYTYNPEKAKELLSQAGYQDGFSTTFLIPANGSGMMWPQTMNEYLQQNLAEVGIKVEFKTVDWQTMVNAYKTMGFTGEYASFGGLNMSQSSMMPNNMKLMFATSYHMPNGSNIGNYSNEEVDELFVNAGKARSGDDRDNYIREANKLITDDAPWIFVCSDNNLRVLAPNVGNFVQPKSWFVDLTKVSVN